MKNKIIITLLSGVFFSISAAASDASDVSFSLGAGAVRQRSIYESKDKYETLPLAVVNLRYNNFYVDFDEVGYDFYKEDGMKLSLIGKVHLGYDSDDLKAEFDSMDDRAPDFHLGLKTTYDYEIYKFTTFATADVSGRSDGKLFGFEGRAKYTLIDEKLYFIPSIGASYGDKHFVDYFYGVKGVEAVDGGINDGQEYRGAGEMIYGIKGIISYIYDSDLSFQWINGVNFYGGNINNSPIVDKDYSVYTGVTITYKFI